MQRGDAKFSDAVVTLSDGSTTSLVRLREDAVLVLVFLRHFG
jgi:hypothetical protein